MPRMFPQKLILRLSIAGITAGLQSYLIIRVRGIKQRGKPPIGFHYRNTICQQFNQIPGIFGIVPKSVAYTPILFQCR